MTSSTLFVDVDDTLVDWGTPSRVPHPGGLGHAPGVSPKLNSDVIQLMNAWEGPIVLWSVAGVEYARGWMSRLIAERPEFFEAAISDRLRCAYKDPKVLTHHDVVVEDDSTWRFDTVCTTIDPRDLAGEA